MGIPAYDVNKQLVESFAFIHSDIDVFADWFLP